MKERSKETNNDEYYNILGLKKDCTPQEIKKQYYKMALKWHPDKQNPNSNTKAYFTKVQEAYSTLSNQRKKKVYDKYGKEGLAFQEECSRSSQPNQYNEFFKNEFLGSQLSGFEVLKNILQDKNDSDFNLEDNSGFFKSSQTYFKSFFDDNILSTESDDEKNDFCSSYKPTFLNKDFMSSTDQLEQSIHETEKKYHAKAEKPHKEENNSSSFSFFMNAIKKGYSNYLQESEDDEVYIDNNYFSKRINPNESMINATYFFDNDDEEEDDFRKNCSFLNSNSKRIKKENIKKSK